MAVVPIPWASSLGFCLNNDYGMFFNHAFDGHPNVVHHFTELGLG
jgi:hypothetical protein